MRVIRDERWRAFLNVDLEALGGQRVKRVRHEPLTPGGRTRLTLFEQVEGAGRPHPRLRVAMPPAEDPGDPSALFVAPDADPATDAEAEAAVTTALEAARTRLKGEDLDPAAAPEGSPRYWHMSITAQRTARFFAEARAWLDDLGLDAAYAVSALEDEAYAGQRRYDDHDTGTYHSFKNDEPFVHYLEELLGGLPADGSEALAVLPSEQQAAIRRQREQARAHLDHLMRHKYAHDGIAEMDIERSLGGLLICRETRQRASETPESADSLAPAFELLRVRPGSAHPKAGTWLWRVGDALHDAEGPVEVDEADLRRIPRKPRELTFRRAPNDPGLRPNVRFDWDGDGWVAADPIPWISWAGHCDVKAVVEQLGITFRGGPYVKEWRSDTGEATLYDRDLLLEAFTSILELGSIYDAVDGGGAYQLGVHKFGGSRNDSRPDRLQFQGLGPGRSFRWPLTGRRDTFVVSAITTPDGPADMETVFRRHHEVPGELDFTPNPAFLRTVEGDYNLITVTGATLEARLELHGFDPTTGHLRRHRERTTVDLRPEATDRSFLGTHLADAAQRRLYRVYWDPSDHAIVAELEQWTLTDGTYQAERVASEDARFPMRDPLAVTLSREMKRDDASVFTELLQIATRQGQNICADTDMQSEVWNGCVTALSTKKLAEDRDRRTERWRVEINARFGDASYEYLLRRDATGGVTETCTLPTPDRGPDFLWQDWPDVGSKGTIDGDWVVNRSMEQRGVVAVRPDFTAPGGYYVDDDHIKNVYELCFCGLADRSFTIVHANKRWSFPDEATWQKAVDALNVARAAVAFDTPVVA